MNRERKVAKAQALRAQGLKLREIGARMGVATSTVDTWLSDPDLAKQRARRERYAGRCEVCGAKTTGCNGAAAAPTVCAKHRDDENNARQREHIISEIHRFAKEHGRPPGANDWAVRNEWPWPNTVRYQFGSFNSAIREAGYDPTPATGPPPWSLSEAQLRRTIRLYRRLGPAAAARELGITSEAVQQRIKTKRAQKLAA